MNASEPWLEELPLDDCLRLLRMSVVGRISVVINGFPVILPVNYTLVENLGKRWLAFRTRPDNVIDRAPVSAAFEVDGIDPVFRQGWSVLARGTLHHVDPDAADFRELFDPKPWLLDERDAWMVIDPFTITGRRLHAAEQEWVFHAQAYL